jgi:hypothetical protein
MTYITSPAQSISLCYREFMGYQEFMLYREFIGGQMCMPPSTGSAAPVTNELSELGR